jgi:hypothetical protein
MKLPVIQGVIRRRILANFRVDPEVMQREMPDRFRPKLQHGYAVAGICLIRLDHVRPKSVPEVLGIGSENAAHRVAVVWDEKDEMREGVFISRRDSNSHINQIFGGRIFPGEHHAASFSVTESQSELTLEMESKDAQVKVEIAGTVADGLPDSSIFKTLQEASTFFEGGSLGYSVTRDSHRLDGLRLETKQCEVAPLEVSRIYSSYFSDKSRFPQGTIAFDHALIMRNVEHEWHSADELYI